MKTWSITWQGLKTVTILELKQRVRSRRWLAAVIAWFVIIGAITLLVANATKFFDESQPTPWCYENGTTQVCVMPNGADPVPTECTIDAAGAITCGLPKDNQSAPTTTVCTPQADGSVVCDVPGDDWSLPQTCTVKPDGTGTCVYQPVDGWVPGAETMVFGIVVLFVLGLGLLVSPALTATSINGDRHAGTLATLQATKLSAATIALGKLGAAWLTMLGFLIAAVPWLAIGVVTGGVPISRILFCFAVLLVELAVICAIGLGWSALISRTSGSSLLTYASVAILSFLTIILIVLLVPFVNTPTEVRVWRLPAAVEDEWQAKLDAWNQEYGNVYVGDEPSDVPPPPAAPVSQCHWETETMRQMHTERVWWLITANPFVIVADAGLVPSIATTHPELYSRYGSDPLFLVRQGVWQLATPPSLEIDQCPYWNVPDTDTNQLSPVSPVQSEPVRRVTVWPWGLGFSLVLGGFFFWIAVRRLRIPYGTLPKGTRVA
jgi:hypothetical protein